MSKRRSKPRVSEVINRIVDIGVAVLSEDLRLDADKVRASMREVAHSFCSEYGGQSLYLPRDFEIALEKRDIKIWESYNGRNSFELSQEFNLTDRQIRFILAMMRKREAAARQHDLPGMEQDI